MTETFRFEPAPRPPAPGEVLREKLLEGFGLTQAQLARALGISCPRLNMIVKGRCQISPEIALRIERVFDISPQYWLRIGNEFELFEERRRIARELENLTQLATVQHRQAAVWIPAALRVAA